MAYTPWAVADVLSAAKLNAQTPIGSYEMFVPANAITPWFASPSFGHEVLTNPTYGGYWVGLRFAPDAYGHAFALLALPKAVNVAAGVTAQIFWTNTAGGGGNVIWPIWMGAAGHGSYIGNWINTHYMVASAGPQHGLARHVATVGGAVQGLGPHKLTQMIIGRYGPEALDSYPYDAYLLGVKLSFQTSEVNDA